MPARFDRRRFLHCSTATLGLGMTGVATAADETARPGLYLEPARELPVVAEADVVVAGSGPAGAAAALAAARTGAKTCLLEVNGCLGGVWTAGLLSNVIDYENKTGIMAEIMRELDARDARHHRRLYDAEVMKLLLEDLLTAAGVRIRLHTRVAAAIREGRRLTGVITESPSGREVFRGKVFIDATGDGDLGAQAGCGFDYGRPGLPDEDQPMSFLVHLTGLDLEQVKPFVSGLPGEVWGEPKLRLAEQIIEATGQGPSYAHPTLFHLGKDLYALMANHEYRVRGFNADELTEATLRGRRECHRMIDGLRKLGGVWKDVRICASAERIGVRASRRVHGLYTVTADDLVRGARHEDAVCRATFCVDIHATDPGKSKGIEQDRPRAVPYDIPYRALIARDVDGLLLAGRCISGDFYAHASYRVTGNAVPMGEAVGTAAALAAAADVLPQDMPWTDIQARLRP